MTTISNPIIVGIFQDQNDAKSAIDELRNMGFSNDQIGVAMPEGGLTPRNIRDDFVNVGVPADAADYYQQQYSAGNTIVSVRPDGNDQAVIDLFNRYGASMYNRGATVNQDVDYATTSSNVAQTYDTGTQQTYDTDAEGQRSLKLREEQLRAQKQTVEAGQVRLGKDVVTEEQTLNVPTSREEVYIERRPGSGQVSDAPISEGETIDVPVREEQVTVEKQPVVREEIALGKRAVQENQQVKDTVRREEAHIERSGDVNIQGDRTDDLTTNTDTNA